MVNPEKIANASWATDRGLSIIASKSHMGYIFASLKSIQLDNNKKN